MADSSKRAGKKRKATNGDETPLLDNKTSTDDQSFTSFKLDPRLLKAITVQFEKPTLVQEAAIPLALKGRDIVARAKTGSGKTLAYVIPIVNQILRKSDDTGKGPHALVLVPTKELAEQVTHTFTQMTTYCDKLVKAVNLAIGTEQVQKTLLSQTPEIIVSTPSRLVHHVKTSSLSLKSLTSFVIDEADLILSYGYESDLQQLTPLIPKSVQAYLMSATLTEEISTLKQSMCRKPAILKLEDAERDTDTLTQYYVECVEDDKFLLIYVILKLKLLKGKCIVFVNDIDRCYRVKLFLEQFGIRSCVLNAELPLNSRFNPRVVKAQLISRLHIVEEFNKGVYDIILATDDANVPEEPTTDNEDESLPTKEPSESSPKKRKRADTEYGVSRGIDFQNVSFVLNFDLPKTSKSYLHRIGRTARANQPGTSLSFIIPPHEHNKSKHSSIPSTKNDIKVLDRIRSRLAASGRKDLEQYQFDPKQLEAFRYRMTDALRAVTRTAVHQARAQEIRKEILASEKLKRHFEDNPGELEGLRHDADVHVVRSQAHLKFVPDYLLPGGGKGGKDLGFIGYRKQGENRIRKARSQARSKKKAQPGKASKGKKRDPLKSFRSGK